MLLQSACSTSSRQSLSGLCRITKGPPKASDHVLVADTVRHAAGQEGDEHVTDIHHQRECSLVTREEGRAHSNGHGKLRGHCYCYGMTLV
jgi:hypothetical protein